jgi:copper homeostasis protein
MTSAVAAVDAGATRLELNSALQEGGLTPSYGLVTGCLEACRVPLVCMARPRAAGFCYSEEDVECLLRDASWLAREGVAGICVGVLTPEGLVDARAARRIVSVVKAHNSACELVFSRAFDLTPSLPRALETLIELGFDRVLTSGGAPSAPAGTPMLRELVTQAAGRIQILAGAGVTAATLPPLLDLGLEGIHGSFSTTAYDAPGGASSTSPSTLGAPGTSLASYPTCDHTLVAAAKALIRTQPRGV